MVLVTSSYDSLQAPASGLVRVHHTTAPNGYLDYQRQTGDRRFQFWLRRLQQTGLAQQHYGSGSSGQKYGLIDRGSLEEVRSHQYGPKPTAPALLPLGFLHRVVQPLQHPSSAWLPSAPTASSASARHGGCEARLLADQRWATTCSICVKGQGTRDRQLHGPEASAKKKVGD